MSQEEIDRILKADFSDIDGAIEKKISSIDQMASKLNQKSNFLAQFQSLLQNQLGNALAIEQKEDKRKKQIVERGQERVNIDSVRRIDEFTQTNLPTLVQQKKGCLCSSIVERIKINLQEYKVHFLCLKQEIGNEIKHYRSIVTQNISQQIETFQKTFLKQQKQAYQHIINGLRTQIAALSQQKTKRINAISPLRQITFNKLNAEITESFNITKRLIEYNSQQAKQHKKIIKNEVNDKFPLSIRKNTRKQQTEDSFVNELFMKEEVDSGENQNKRKSQCDLPSIRPLTIGIPPVRDGFGVLKQGNHVIYRGQWRNGRFQGSGKLIWDGYNYEGGFKNGYFEGHGTLTYNGITFIGKFAVNKACGQGTIIFPSRKIIGLWSQNNCLRLL